MIAPEASRARRWLALLLPVVALFVLVVVGRRATSAAPVLPSTPSAIASAEPVGDAAPLPAIASASSVVADAGDAPRSAVEQLADGGVIVDLNAATEADLRRLPGVGPARARKILELRTRLGRFKSVDDLARIKGFGKRMIKRLRPLARAGA